MSNDSPKSKATSNKDAKAPEVPSNDDVVRILTEQNKLLELATKQALQRVADDWLWPKAAMSFVTAIIALLAVCFFVPQYYAISEISSRSKEFKKIADDANQKISLYDERFDAQIRDFNDKNSQLLSSAITEQSNNIQANMADVERAHHCLTLVAMGREHVSLKRNPHLALLYAEAAMNIFNSSRSHGATPASPSGTSTILAAVYPAIWNLQMDCMLQLHQFGQLRKMATDVLGRHTTACLDESKYCSLRSAFYNRAIATIPELCRYQQGVNPDRQNSEYVAQYKAMGNQFISDIDNGIGGQADQSIGTIYKALYFIYDGRYKDAQELVDRLRGVSDGLKTRPTIEQSVTLQLASTTRALLDFITNKDKSDTSVKCNLDPAALTPWDAFLLEDLVGLIARGRSWHIRVNADASGGDTSNVDYANRLGIFCVNWIQAIRIACADSNSSKPCAGCSPPPVPLSRAGESENGDTNEPTAELFAEYGIKDFYGDVAYSKNRELGRVVRGHLFMKYSYTKTVYHPVQRTVTGPDNVTRQVADVQSVVETRVVFSKHEIGKAIPPRAYMAIKDSDMPDIYKILDSPMAPEAPVPAPVAPKEAPKPAK